MTTVTVNSPTFPSLLSLVNRVLNECGVESNTSLAAQNFRSNTVLQAINDAVADIYYRDRWFWQKSLTYLTLVAGTDQYAMPADFMRLAHPPVINGVMLQEYTQEEWLENIPQPSGSSTAQGQPQACCFDMNIIRLWPIPDANTVSQFPQMGYTYYRGPGVRLDTTNDAATVNLPIDFLEAVVAFARGVLKQHLEFPDQAVQERQRYEQAIQVQMARNSRSRVQPRLKTLGQPSNSYSGWSAW